MSVAQQNSMVAALGKIDKAVDDFAEPLAAAIADYSAAFEPYARSEHTVSVTRRETLEATVGMTALYDAIVRRLRAAGLGPVLKRAQHTRGSVSDLAGVMTGKIRAHVK